MIADQIARAAAAAGCPTCRHAWRGCRAHCPRFTAALVKVRQHAARSHTVSTPPGDY